jgi:hypothetical protein
MNEIDNDDLKLFEVPKKPRWIDQRTDEVTQAQEAALDLASDWKHFADKWFRGIYSGTKFTSEDITEAVGLPAGEEGMNRNNAVGAYMRALSSAGLVKKVGMVSSRRAVSHGAALIEWEKC